MKTKNEIKLAEIKAKLEGNAGDISSLEKNRADLHSELAECNALIEAEKKPELRDGDYGYITDLLKPSNCDSFIISGFDGDEIWFTQGNRSGTGKMQTSSFRKRIIVVLGNIFDDLAALQQNVTEFKMESCGGCTVKGEFGTEREVTLFFGTRQATFRGDRLGKYINYLRQIHAEQKRRQNE